MNLSALPGPRPLLLLGVLGWVYWPTFLELYDTWSTNPEYSHGMLVPLFALYLLVKRKPVAPTVPDRPWPVIGFASLALAVLMRLGGSATSFLPLEGLSFILCLAALAVLAGGRAGLARYWPSVVFLVFMIPLPYEMSRLMGAELQRVATVCTTFVLQCLGQPAVAEGNRILIGNVTLNVVEACSGLRMLMTFFAFSVAAVLLMERHWLVKVLVLAGAIPIALATNILRITATGLAHLWLNDGDGKTRVLDFIHDFNGWMMMPVGLTFLLVELWLFKHLLIERPAAVGPRPAVSTPAPTAAAKPRFASVIQMPTGR
ncbi:MAG TPA: exosortase/archaeosortase family protein [Gemmataceae bacterium]|nr:exosortase/archaeosortase family protein [Gemmataceae bacterium]